MNEPIGLLGCLKADLFVITTQVDKVALNFGKPDQQLLDTLTLAEAKEYHAQGHFLAGSMGPKIQSIIWYLEGGGKEALITSPENISLIHISEPTRQAEISYAVFCLKKKKPTEKKKK